MACSNRGLTDTKSTCHFALSSMRKKKYYTTTFPKPCSKWTMPFSEAYYESGPFEENRSALHYPSRRRFLSELAMICPQSSAFASTLQSGQVGNPISVRYKGKEWSVILPDLYQRVAIYSNKEGTNSCENCRAEENVNMSKSESPLLAHFISQSGETDITISAIGANSLKLSLLQINTIEELGSLDSTSALFLPSTAKIEGTSIRKSNGMKTFYSWDFVYGNQRVLLTVIFSSYSTF